MSNATFVNQVYVFSALYRCSALVHQIATEGKCSYEEYKSMIKTLFVDDFISIDNTFDGVEKLKSSLEICKKSLSMTSLDHTTMHINRYATLILVLEGQLRDNNDLLQNIVERLKNAREHLSNIDRSIEALIADCANVYGELVSPNASKIIIKGAQGHLKNEFNAKKIRTLLLTGLHLAILWRQLGGRRWHILFKRTRIINTCHKLSSQI